MQARAVGGHDQRAIVQGTRLLRHPHLLDPRQQIVDAHVEARGELRLGRHDVDALNPLQPRKQIGISGPESASLHQPVSHRDDDAAIPRGQVRLDQPVTERMLVTRVRLPHAALVRSKRGNEEPRLAQHALGTAIDPGARLELRREQPLEVVHLPPPPPQLVVELEHLADERRPQVEGRNGALGDGFVGPGLQHDLAIECAQPCSGRCGGIPQPLVQLCTGEDVGEDDRGPHVGEAGLFHRALQLESRRARRHDHRRGAHERELPIARRRDDGALVGVQGTCPEEPHVSCCGHGCRGGTR